MKNREGYAEGDRRRTFLVRRGWPSAYAMPRVAVGLTDGTVSAPYVLAGMCHASACYAEGRHYAEGDRRCSVYYAEGWPVGLAWCGATPTAPTFGRRRSGRPSAHLAILVVTAFGGRAPPPLLAPAMAAARVATGR